MNTGRFGRTGVPVSELCFGTMSFGDQADASEGCCQANRGKHQKPVERAFYEAIRERHSVRAASRFSLKVLRVDSDLCALK